MPSHPLARRNFITSSTAALAPNAANLSARHPTQQKRDSEITPQIFNTGQFYK